jgi:hypothetical protein
MQQRIVTAFATLILALCVPAAQADDLTPTKRADVRTLIQVIGAGNLWTTMAVVGAQQIVQQVRASGKEVSAKAAQGVLDELNGVFKEEAAQPGGLIDKLEPVYAKNFTHPEVKELITFLKSPVGQKFSSTMPVVFRESMQAAQEWVNTLKPKIDARVTARLKKEGVDLPPKVAPAQHPLGPTPQSK